AETANPLMKVSAKPARSISRAEWASKQHGITCRPERASTARSAAALDSAGIGGQCTPAQPGLRSASPRCPSADFVRLLAGRTRIAVGLFWAALRPPLELPHA